MPPCSGWDIWLEIEGKRLEEYGIKQNKSERVPSVTCWVPCEAGKEFKIGVAPPPKPRKSNHLLNLFADGRFLIHVGNRNFTKEANYGPEKPQLYEGKEDDQGFRPFMFANLTLTDDDDFLGAGIGKLGRVKVEIYKYRDFVKKECKPKKRARLPAPGPLPKPELGGVVHEKTNKGALTNCVKFGEPKPRPGAAAAASRAQTADLSGVVASESKPKAKEYTTKYTYKKLVGLVIFKYRSIDILRADGIAPSAAAITTSPSPERPLPAPNSEHGVSCTPTLQAEPNLSDEKADIKMGGQDISDNEDEDDEELRALQARMAILEELSEVKAQIAAKLSKKRKRDSKEKSDEPQRVKKEVKVEHFVPGEVIDLT